MQYFSCLSRSFSFSFYLQVKGVINCICWCDQCLDRFFPAGFKVPATFLTRVCVFYVLAGFSKSYLSSTVPSAVTMATSTGFSSCAALKNVKLTYNAMALMGAAGPQCSRADETSFWLTLCLLLWSAVLLNHDSLPSEGSKLLLLLATVIICAGSANCLSVSCISRVLPHQVADKPFQCASSEEELHFLHCFCFSCSVRIKVKSR